ncbi:MAG: SLC13 family permease, partial [Bacteroidota bacterium]
DLDKLRVPEGSGLVGLSPAEAGLRQRHGVNIVDIRRRGPMGLWRRLLHTGNQAMEAHDEIDVQGTPEAVAAVVEAYGLERVERMPTPEATLAEVLLTPRSRLIGKTLAEADFRERFGANVLSIKRRGKPVPGPLAEVPLRFADTLLVAGGPRVVGRLRQEPGDLLVVARTQKVLPDGPLTAGQMTSIALVVGMMALLTLEIVAPVIAVLLAAVGMVLTRCIRIEAAYRTINWESVVLIAAILPMATALQKTGGVDLVVAQLSALGEAGPLALLAALFVVTGTLSQVISNTATAVLLAPVALGAAVELGVSPYPFLMGVAVAASSAFATPVASPINTLVLGPGAYRFGDFLTTGLIVQALLLGMTLLLVPLLFPF